MFLSYNQCLGAKEDPFAFTSLCLEDLRNGQSQYLIMIKQLIDALPKTESPTSHFALRGHIARPGQHQLGHSMWAAIWWLLPSDGEFRRSSHSLQYYLTRQGRRVVLRGGDVTQPLYESRINWVHDPTSPTPHRQDDLTSPALASAENTPPSEVHHKLPRRLRPRRRRRKQPVSSANENSASRVADPATPLGPSANENSPRLPPSAVTRLRSTANRNSPFPGPQSGTSRSSRSAFLKHPQSFQSSPLSQHPVPVANQNRDRPFFLDHPEIRGVYKPARIDPRQDSTDNRQRNNFSGFGLSSPALQQPPYQTLLWIAF